MSLLSSIMRLASTCLEGFLAACMANFVGVPWKHPIPPLTSHLVQFQAPGWLVLPSGLNPESIGHRYGLTFGMARLMSWISLPSSSFWPSLTGRTT